MNDMKTIMSEREFGTLIGHLAAVQGVAVKKVEDDWAPARSFAVAERSNEPPLPG